MSYRPSSDIVSLSSDSKGYWNERSSDNRCSCGNRIRSYHAPVCDDCRPVPEVFWVDCPEPESSWSVCVIPVESWDTESIVPCKDREEAERVAIEAAPAYVQRRVGNDYVPADWVFNAREAK